MTPYLNGPARMAGCASAALAVVAGLVGQTGQAKKGKAKAMAAKAMAAKAMAAKAAELALLAKTEEHDGKRLEYVLRLGDLAPFTHENKDAVAAVDEFLSRVRWKVIRGETERVRTQLLYAVLRVDVRSRMHPKMPPANLAQILRDPSDETMHRLCRREATFGYEPTDARICAAEFLAKHGRKAVPYLSDLETVLGETLRNRERYLAESKHWSYSMLMTAQAHAIARAMTKIAPRDPRTGLAYGVLLTEDKDTAVRRSAAMTIGQFGPKAEATVPMLIQALEDEDARVVAESVTALGMIGSAAKKAIPKLEKMQDHEDKQVRARAAATLKQIQGCNASSTSGSRALGFPPPSAARGPTACAH